MSITSPQFDSHLVETVQGRISYDRLGITDAHNHVWIESIPGTDPTNPILDQFDQIVRELIEYRDEGGQTLLDCQPFGCGRNGNRLSALSRESEVYIIACTGFHRRIYYPLHHWFWSLTSQEVSDFLYQELNQGLYETQDIFPVRAGFIKIALEQTWSECPRAALEGAAAAAVKSKALLEIHTERGALAEHICTYFIDLGVSPCQLVLCHMDKRPDFGLHKELAALGILLEYDTFYRPKYNPQKNLWPLIEAMVDDNLFENIALATDMAETALYHFLGNGPGLVSLPGEIQDQLIIKGFPEVARSKMLGGNIARRLAGIPYPNQGD